MPEAVMQCTVDGQSCCAGSSERRRCLGTVAHLTSTFGTVEVAELE